MNARLLPAAAVMAFIAGCAGVGVPPSGPAASVDDGESGRLAEQLERCRQLQRDERRKVEQLSHRLREERHKNEAMQRKLESLRAIDREMMMERKAP